ncbi:MAG TPA: AraC family transcriptional regulator [Novosphingobium sp.]|nr:AraC family transcriptional regulator [Novosphingobium sp.]
MPRIAFRTDDLPVATRMSAWGDILDKFALRPDFAETPRALQGRVDHVYSPRGMGFSTMEAHPQRLASREERAGEDMFFLSIVPEGVAEVETDGGLTLLSPGDMLYGRRGVVGALRAHTAFKFLNVNMPAGCIERAAMVDLPRRLVHLRGDAPVARVLAAMLREIAHSLDRLDGASTFAIEAAIVQLVVNTVFEATGASPLGGFATVRAALLRRIWQTIEANLTDLRLSLGEVARENGMTPRYLQQLFEENGQSFRGYVRQRRLEKCRVDLANPVNVHVPVGEICMHWGFGDSAAFSRAFRGAYGCTPSDYRRDALGGKANLKTRLRGLDRVEA